MSRAVRRFVFGSPAPGHPASEAVLLAARVFTGLAIALGHGVKKVPPPERFVGTIEAMGLPAPELFAWFAAFAELGGGLLLAIGLLVRPAAIAVAITMAVAAFIRHAADPFGQREPALLFLTLSLVFAALGGGRFALDALLARRIASGRGERAGADAATAPP